MFLNSINHFRAIAIVAIVAGHCFYIVDVSFDTFPERVLGNLVEGGTVLFVFISGFLFHHIFYKRYQFKKFMTGKLKKVFLPYTLLSILPILRLVLRGDAFYDYYDPQGTGLVSMYIVPALKYYLTGGFLVAYWYIPFAMIIFSMSPLHVAFIKLRFKQQLIITFLLFVVALFLHRPVNDIFIPQAVVYFTPVYLLGIVCSQKKAAIYAKLQGKEIYFLGIAIALAMLQAVIGPAGNYHKPPMAYGGLDLLMPQKVALCFFFMIWLHRFEQVKTGAINVLAATSFAIYFMHSYLLSIFRLVEPMMGGIDMAQNPWLWYPFVTSGVIMLCLTLALLIKKLLPNYSRYVVGY